MMDREKLKSLRGDAKQRVEEFMGKNVKGSGKISWGLVVFAVVGVYALVQLIRSVVFFFG